LAIFSGSEEIKKQVEQFAIPVFPRTLAEYINPLVSTGFVLKKNGGASPFCR